MDDRSIATVAVFLWLAAACGDGDGAGSPDGSESTASSGTDASTSSGDRTAGDSSTSAEPSSSAASESESGSDDGGTGDPPEPACGGGESDYPLEIISPKPVGDAPDGLDPAHRIYRAHPGIDYEIRVAAVGGNYPFTYALSNAPVGMSIDAGSGEIVWTDPQEDASDVTVTVTDATGTETSETWSIDVTTEGFSFVDAVGGDSAGAGTQDDPWRTLADVWTRGGAGGIVYFRGGEDAIYTPEGIPVENPDTDGEMLEFHYAEQPVIWLAHPDDDMRPVLDFGFTGTGEGAHVPVIRLSGPAIWVDGIETTRSHRMAFQVVHYDEHGATFRRLHMHDGGPGIDGGNSAFIMYVRCDDCPAYGDVVQDNEFSELDYGTGNCALKLYSMERPLVADNVFHHTGEGEEAVVAIKDNIAAFEVRGNTFHDIGTLALGGNMHATTFPTSGEFRFNNVRTAGRSAMRLNQDGMVGRIRAYRNTLQGRVEIRIVDAEDGPIAFERNVIVNDDGMLAPRPFFYYVDVADPTRITADDDLMGAPADGVVDELGELVDGFLRWLGTHGHALAPCD